MSSTNKTKNLKLNCWDEADIPKRSDFNYDNQMIDNVVSDHTGNTEVHITNDERTRWNKYIHIGMYYGNGSPNRKIDTECPFDVSFGIIFANNRPASITRFSDARDYNYFGFVSQSCNTLGVTLQDDWRTLSVNQSSSPIVAGEHTYFNEGGLAYTYVLFR